MQLQDLALTALRIPFRVSFKHAAAERRITQSFLAIASSNSGMVGYGEGCPRAYVTGETDASVQAFFQTHKAALLAQVVNLDSLIAWIDAHSQEIDHNPAAWCALELALLDLIARDKDQTVEDLLNLPALAGPFLYSAVLGVTEITQFSEIFARYQKLGMRNYKIKLSGEIERDRERIALLRDACISPPNVRADANNLWAHRSIAQAYLEKLAYAFAALEEPLQPGHFADLAALAQAFSTRIVLDESIARVEQLAQLPGDPRQWIVNLRVSKMGGLLRSLALAEHCKARGIDLVVGAQVGETSLLTRVALVVAQTARDIVIAQEGAFGTLLLETDAVHPSLMFGPGGVLDVAAIPMRDAKGWGLTPSAEIVAPDTLLARKT